MVHLIKAALGNINSRHGEQIGRGFPHVGIDIGWGGGLELYAPAAGWLTWSWAGSYGNLGRINHADGSYSRIAHADSYNGVNGRDVEQGEHIGTMGRSGGPWGTSGWFVHCHQEYWVDGVAVDPTDYMGASPAGENITPITSGDDDMATLELVQTAGGKEGIFYSVNRLQRYAVDGPTTLADYQFFITEHRKAGNIHAKPDVQIVKNLAAFGAIVR